LGQFLTESAAGSYLLDDHLDRFIALGVGE
jgi:hypothetical protein